MAFLSAIIQNVFIKLKQQGGKFNKANLNDEGILKELTKITVDAWIASNNHNYLIRSKLVDYSTITSIMRRDGNRFKLTVSYHAVYKKCCI